MTSVASLDSILQKVREYILRNQLVNFHIDVIDEDLNTMKQFISNRDAQETESIENLLSKQCNLDNSKEIGGNDVGTQNNRIICNLGTRAIIGTFKNNNNNEQNNNKEQENNNNEQ